jgi:hypothetical protein
MNYSRGRMVRFCSTDTHARAIAHLTWEVRIAEAQEENFSDSVENGADMTAERPMMKRSFAKHY